MERGGEVNMIIVVMNEGVLRSRHNHVRERAKEAHFLSLTSQIFKHESKMKPPTPTQYSVQCVGSSAMHVECGTCMCLASDPKM